MSSVLKMSFVDNLTPGCDVKKFTNNSDICFLVIRLLPFFSFAMCVIVLMLLMFRFVQINKIKSRIMRFFTIILHLQ